MNRVIFNLVADKIYNLDFEAIRNLITPLREVEYENDHFYYDKNFLLIISSYGGVNIGIDYQDKDDLEMKFENAIRKLRPVREYYKNKYNEDIFKELFLTWSNNDSKNNINWKSDEFVFKESKFNSRFNYEYSNMSLT